MIDEIKLLVVSHSYSVDENRKNIDELRQHVSIKVVLPEGLYDPIQGWQTVKPGEGDDYLIFRRLSLPRSQYLLVSRDFGMRAFQPDIIHVEYDPWSIIFWQVAAYRRLYASQAKIVCTVKKNTYRRLPWLLETGKNTIAQFFIKKVAHFIAISNGVRDIYVNRFKVPTNSVTVMQHLGLDLSLFVPRKQPWHPANPGSVVIGYCGRLDTDKGIEELLTAVGELSAKEGPVIKVKLLGNGKLRDELVERNIAWLEVLDPVPHGEVADFMHSIDIFVLPSHITPDHEEHDAHALLEALACGVPSIASSSGIIPEVLDDGCGLVFAASDVKQLIERIEQLIMDEGLRETISKLAVEGAQERFSLAGIAKQRAEIYERLQA